MYYQANAVDVALRKESVDRNIVSAFDVLAVSALPVALRKESVDRNWPMVVRSGVRVGRSPQGERG